MQSMLCKIRENTRGEVETIITYGDHDKQEGFYFKNKNFYSSKSKSKSKLSPFLGNAFSTNL